jgi:hypothetical protein
VAKTGRPRNTWLSPRREEFAECVASGLPLNRSYGLAYGRLPDRTARTNASRLMRVPAIRRRIDEIRAANAVLAGARLRLLIEEFEEEARAQIGVGDLDRALRAMRALVEAVGLGADFEAARRWRREQQKRKSRRQRPAERSACHN